MKEQIKNIINNPKSKYICVIVSFFILMLFSKQTNVFYYYRIAKQKKELENLKEFYIKEIKKDSLNTLKIQKNLDAAEKFGREKYLMKRDNEDIFIIRHAEDTLLNNTIE